MSVPCLCFRNNEVSDDDASVHSPSSLVVVAVTSNQNSPDGGSTEVHTEVLDERRESMPKQPKTQTSSSSYFKKRREKSAMILVSIVVTFLVCHTFRYHQQLF